MVTVVRFPGFDHLRSSVTVDTGHIHLYDNLAEVGCGFCVCLKITVDVKYFYAVYSNISMTF